MLDDNIDKNHILFAGLFSVFVLLFFLIKNIFFYKDFFVVCDVGQGDAIYLRLSKKDVLLDSGPSREVLYCLGKNMPFWDKKIELVIITHPHKDHYGGLDYVLNYYQVERVVLPAVVNLEAKSYISLLEDLDSSKVELVDMQKGERIDIGKDFSLRFYWPDSEYLKRNLRDVVFKINDFSLYSTDKDLNDFSYVLSLDFQDNIFAVFTGDISSKVLGEIYQDIKGYKNPIFFKYPHHGSVRSLNKEVFNSLETESILISVGKKNPYGHPSPAVLRFLEEQGKNIITTSEAGNIKIFIRR